VGEGLVSLYVLGSESMNPRHRDYKKTAIKYHLLVIGLSGDVWYCGFDGSSHQFCVTSAALYMGV
jgi:hypothetical protein